MTADQLRKSILQQAIQGKLVPQDPNDEPASVLLERIREEKARLVEEKKIKKEKNPSVIFRGEDNSYYEKFTLSGEVKCIEEEIPFEIPNGWEWCRLENLGEIIATKPFQILQSEIEKIGDIPVISQSANYVDGFSNSKKKILTIDRFAIVFGDHTKIVKYVDFNFIVGADGVKIIIPNSFLTKYLYYLILSLSYKIKDRGYSRHFQFLCEKLFPLPPLNEQLRIVEKIEELIPHIEHYGKAQAELDLLNKNIKEQLKKSILQYAIEGKLVPQDETEGTAEVLLEQIQKERQKLYEENKLKKKDLEHSIIFKGEDNKYYEKIGKNVICIDEEIPFEIPKDWRWYRVSNISQSYIGLTYRPEEIKKEGVIVLRSSNIKDGKIVLQDIVRVSKEIPDKLLVKENDIIICARNGSQKLVGKSALIEKIVEPTTFGAFMAICKTPFYKYMYLFLQSNCFFSQLKNVSGTTTINQLTQSSLNNFLIPLPPLAEQLRIVESIDTIFRCIERN